MNANVDPFRILGLAPTASLGEAQSAYKDLIRVWHPDRFTSEPRLRAKAEEQTRLLNEAIAQLRRTLRSNVGRPQPQPSDPSPSRTAPSPRKEAPPTLRTLELRTVRSHVVRGIIAYAALLTVGAFNVLRLESESSISVEYALSALVAVYSLSHILTNRALFFCNTPIISINLGEMRVLGLPRIPMTDMWEAWFSTSREEIYLRLIVTEGYLKTLPLLTRLWLKLVKFYRGFHIQVPCGSLDTHPSNVINVIQLANAYGAAPLISRPHKRISWAIHADAIATLSVLILVIRCVVEHEGYEVSYLPYLIIYLVSRGYAVLESIVLAPRVEPTTD